MSDWDHIPFAKGDHRPKVVSWYEPYHAYIVTCLFARDCDVGDSVHAWAFPDAQGLDKVVALGGRWERQVAGWLRVK